MMSDLHQLWNRKMTLWELWPCGSMISRWKLKRVMNNMKNKLKCWLGRKLHWRSKLVNLKRIIIGWEISLLKVHLNRKFTLLSWLLWYRKRRNKLESFRIPMENWELECKCWKEVFRRPNFQRKKIEKSQSKKLINFRAF